MLDASGFDISPAPAGTPTVAFDGTNHFVAWASPTAPDDDDPLLGRRVSPDRSLVDPVPLSLGPGLRAVRWCRRRHDAADLRVDGDDRLRAPGGDPCRAAQWTSPLDNPPFFVTNPANDQYSPAIAFDGTGHLAVWADQRPGYEYDIYAVGSDRAERGWMAAGSPSRPRPATSSSPRSRSTGRTYLVVWEHQPGDGDDDRSDIFGARVTPAGEVLDPEGIPIATTTDRESRPVVAFDGTNYLVAWHHHRRHTAATRQHRGHSARPRALTISPRGWNAAVAYGAGSYLVAGTTGPGSSPVASEPMAACSIPRA